MGARVSSNPPPHNLEAEQGLLGALLLDAKVLDEMLDDLRPDFFYEGRHRQILTALRALRAEGVAVDLITVTDRLQQTGKIDEAGGALYVTELTGAVPTPALATHYLGIVMRDWKKREALRLGQHLVHAAGNGTGPDELVADIEAALTSLRFDSPTYIKDPLGNRIQSAQELLAAVGQSQAWLPWWGQTGLVGPGLLTILSGHSKVAGKSTALAIAIRDLNRANPEARVLILTEEPRSVWAQRLRNWGLQESTLRFRFADGSPWPSLLKEIAQAPVDVLLVDTVRSFAGIRDENDASIVVEAVQPLVLLARRNNIAVIATHHLRKSEADSGLGHAGSTALVALADVAIELLGDASHAPNRRHLKAVSRFDETPRSLTIELRGQDIVVLGTPEAVGLGEVQERVLAVLRDASETLTVREINSGLSEPRPSPEQLARALRGLHAEDRVTRTGKGVRGNPHRWGVISNHLPTHLYVEESNAGDKRRGSGEASGPL